MGTNNPYIKNGKLYGQDYDKIKVNYYYKIKFSKLFCHPRPPVCTAVIFSKMITFLLLQDLFTTVETLLAYLHMSHGSGLVKYVRRQNCL